MTFPATWTGPQWKPGSSARKAQQHAKRRTSVSHEKAEKAKVRKRDKMCRFPKCGCGKLKLTLEVSHDDHKGAGGDISGGRSMADAMVLLCASRHRESRVSRDKGTLRAVDLTPAGKNGPVSWEVDLWALGLSREVKWAEVAREKAVGVCEPLTLMQREVLETLATMNL